MRRTHRAAEAEFHGAWTHYDDISRKLSERFATEVFAAISAIEEGPERWPKGLGGTRRCLLAHFPYAIIYVSDEKGLLVLAFAHGSRKPDYWADRLLDRV